MAFADIKPRAHSGKGNDMLATVSTKKNSTLETLYCRHGSNSQISVPARLQRDSKNKPNLPRQKQELAPFSRGYFGAVRNPNHLLNTDKGARTEREIVRHPPRRLAGAGGKGELG